MNWNDTGNTRRMGWNDSSNGVGVDYLNNAAYTESSSNTDYKKLMRMKTRIKYSKNYEPHEVDYMIENSVLSE